MGFLSRFRVGLVVIVLVVMIVIVVLVEIVFVDEFAVEEVEFPFPLVLGKRGEDHGDGAAVEFWRLVDLGHGLEVVDDPVEDDEAEFLVGVFTAAELEDEAAFVVGVEEALGAAHLDVVVVFAGADAEFDFLHAGGAFRLLLLQFRLLVLVFAIVDDLADRWVRLFGDFDKIESELHGLGECLADAEDAELLAVGGDDADLGGTDTVVDASHVAETAPVLRFGWLGYGFVLVGSMRRTVGSISRAEGSRVCEEWARNDGHAAGSWKKCRHGRALGLKGGCGDDGSFLENHEWLWAVKSGGSDGLG